MTNRLRVYCGRISACVVLALVCGASLAGKPEIDKHSNGKISKQQRGQGGVAGVKPGAYFGHQHRAELARYYGKQRKAGRCPPGLAKKNNGCMPPGQAKKWALGQPLPKSVVYYPVPQALLIRIGAPPQGYRYARVANDLLLMVIGTRLVVDAVEDLMAL